MKTKYIKTKLKTKYKSRNRESLIALTFIYSSIIFLIQVGILLLLSMVLSKNQIFAFIGDVKISDSIKILIITSTVTGYFISFWLTRLLLHPLKKIISCMNQFAHGNYKERVKFKGPFSSYPAFAELSSSVNTLAEELEHTEIVNNDFVNNFSHEFKTPIASIAGFAKLLKYEDLTEEERKEYLSIIEEESMRLSKLTNNILSMIKLENQTTLTNTNCFNVSEQIRNSIILMEEKWLAKNIDFQIDFDEYNIWGNENLLKQVWINLLDNAIKFSPNDAEIAIDIREEDGEIIFAISNTGSEIPEESQKRIFNKFYQVDESHAEQGNGIGLALVKRIVTLHHGKITLTSANNKTTFFVTLPA